MAKRMEGRLMDERQYNPTPSSSSSSSSPPPPAKTNYLPMLPFTFTFHSILFSIPLNLPLHHHYNHGTSTCTHPSSTSLYPAFTSTLPFSLISRKVYKLLPLNIYLSYFGGVARCAVRLVYKLNYEAPRSGERDAVRLAKQGVGDGGGGVLW